MDCEDLIEIALWAIKTEDLRHQFIYSNQAIELNYSPGIDEAFETTVVVAIFQAAISKNGIDRSDIEHECPYPKSGKINPKRSDLAIKSRKTGANWKYIEVKRASQNWKKLIQNDINKLQGMTSRAQRWIMIYGIDSKDAKRHKKEIIKQYFSNQFVMDEILEKQFITSYNYGENAGLGFVLMAKLRNKPLKKKLAYTEI